MTWALADAEGFGSHTPSLSVGQVGQDMGPCRNGLTGKYGLWEALKVCDGQLVLQAFVCCLTVQRVLQAVTHQPLQAASTQTHARTHARTHTHTHRFTSGRLETEVLGVRERQKKQVLSFDLKTDKIWARHTEKGRSFQMEGVQQQKASAAVLTHCCQGWQSCTEKGRLFQMEGT